MRLFAFCTCSFNSRMWICLDAYLTFTRLLHLHLHIHAFCSGSNHSLRQHFTTIFCLPSALYIYTCFFLGTPVFSHACSSVVGHAQTLATYPTCSAPHLPYPACLSLRAHLADPIIDYLSPFGLSSALHDSNHCSPSSCRPRSSGCDVCATATGAGCLESGMLGWQS